MKHATSPALPSDHRADWGALHTGDARSDDDIKFTQIFDGKTLNGAYQMWIRKKSKIVAKMNWAVDETGAVIIEMQDQERLKHMP